MGLDLRYLSEISASKNGWIAHRWPWLERAGADAVTTSLIWPRLSASYPTIIPTRPIIPASPIIHVQSIIWCGLLSCPGETSISAVKTNVSIINRKVAVCIG